MRIALTFAAGAFVTSGLKLIFRIPRPWERYGDAIRTLHTSTATGYSFPSGHATIAVAFYGFLGYVLIRCTARRALRITLLVASGVLVLAMGLSRIGLGVHYLSDVWAGYLLGTLCLLVGIALNEWLSARGRIVWNGTTTARRRTVAFALVFAAVVGVLIHASTRSLATDAHPGRLGKTPSFLLRA